MVICDKIPIGIIVQEKFFNLQKLNSINMKKIFILLFVSLALFSCEKKKIIKFLNISCCQVRMYLNHLVVWGETYYYFYNYSKTLIDDILDSEVPIIPKDVSIEFDKTLFF